MSVAIFLCVLLSAGFLLIYFMMKGDPSNDSRSNTTSTGLPAYAPPPGPPTSTPANDTVLPESSDEDIQAKEYSRFNHSNAFHSRLPCLVCHRRDDNSARISFPGRAGHTPCIGCHSLQFEDSGSQICTICHTNPQSGGLKRFPGLRSFGVRFDHARHNRVNCATCHKPARGGVAFSIPARTEAHTTCFQCHSSRSANSMSSCGVCHTQGRFVRTPETSRAFAVNFSHAKHDGKQSLNCSSCHTIRAGTARGRQVSAPLVSMHFAPSRSLSCGGCHNNVRAFGGQDFSDCKRCHSGGSFKF